MIGSQPGDDFVRVLVVEGDEALRSRICRVIERNGGRCIAAGVDALRDGARVRPDIVLLDRWEALERMRGLTDAPILMLTAPRAGVVGTGADDYLPKPFSEPELLSRMDALLRRSRSSSVEPTRYGDELVEIDMVDAEARVRGEPLRLTPLEFRLLAALVGRPGRVLSAERLLALVWGDPDLPRGRVKLYVRYVREKFRAAGVEEPPIKTLRGVGYRYVPPR